MFVLKLWHFLGKLQLLLLFGPKRYRRKNKSNDRCQVSTQWAVHHVPMWGICDAVPITSSYGNPNHGLFGCHVLRMLLLYINDLICRYRKRVGALYELEMTTFVVHTKFPILEWWSKVVALVVPFLFHICIIFIYCWTCSRIEYVWNICNRTSSTKQLIINAIIPLAIRAKITLKCHISSCYGVSTYYRFSDLAIDSVNR